MAAPDSPTAGAAAPEDADDAQSHAVSLGAWDVPSAIVAGDAFRITIGMKCASACNLAKSAFAIADHAGTEVAAGILSGDLWPGSTGLYVADVELRAPAEEGLYTWTLRARQPDAAMPHAEGVTSFGVRVVQRPEHLVTVEAVDQATGTPVPGARVVLHPYRAETDERGVARIRVAGGSYRLFVSQTRYDTFGVPLEVSADMTTRAELTLEPVLERN